jgi:hypothetical protein
MSDRGISFKLSRFVDKISGTGTEEMTGKGTNKKSGSGDIIKPPTLNVGGSQRVPTVPMPGTTASTTGTGEEVGRATGTKQTSMKTFLQTAATPTKRDSGALSPHDNAAKRPQDGDSSEGETGEAEWQQELRENMAGVAGLSEQQVEQVMEMVLRAFKLRITEVARRISRAAAVDDYETRKSCNSIIIHRADQWVSGQVDTIGFNLAEKVTKAVHKMTEGAVAVLDAFTLGRWDANVQPTAVMVTFGSRTQKTSFFRILAARARQGAQEVRVISCRDAFPKKHLQSAKDLVKIGADRKTAGAIAAFRVVARGEGCVPVLEVKGWIGEGRRENIWRIYEGNTTGTGMPQREGGARTTREQRRGEGGLNKPATPRKPTGSTSNLSLGRGGVIGGFEDATETVFHEQTEEEMYVEDF